MNFIKGDDLINEIVRTSLALQYGISKQTTPSWLYLI